MYIAYFGGFNGIWVIFKVFRVVFVSLGAFWSFSRIFVYFGHSWCIFVIFAVLRGHFRGFGVFIRFLILM